MELFNCPSCGAALEPDHDHDGFVHCPFCGSQVIVPENLRRPGSVSSRTTTEGGVRVEIHYGQGDAADALDAPDAPAQGPRVRISRGWLTCLVILIFAAILIPVVAAVAIPLAGSAAMFGILNGVLPNVDPNQVNLPLLQTAAPLLQKGKSSFARQTLVFGERGSGDGQFEDTRWVGVDGQGNIYSAEYQNGHIQKFDPQGKFLLGWNIGSEHVLTDLAVSPGGLVYAATGGKILKYDGQDGRMLGQLADADGRYLETVEVGSDNLLTVVAGGEDILRFSEGEQASLLVEKAVSSISGDAELAARAAVDAAGNLYLLGRFNNAVFVYSPEGSYLRQVGSGDDVPGQLRAPNDVAVDGQGRVYVSDIFGVEVFAADGSYLTRVPVDGVAFGLAWDQNGALYLASNAHKIIKLQPVE